MDAGVAAEGVGDEHLGRRRARRHGEVPRAHDVGVGDGLDRRALVVQHDQAPGGVEAGQGTARRGRQAAHHHPAARQDAERGGQPDSPGAGHARRDLGKLSEQAGRAGRGDLDDGRAGALDIGLVVEVAHQGVTGDEPAGGRRDHGQPIGVDVAVGRDRGGDLRDRMQLAQERRDRVPRRGEVLARAGPAGCEHQAQRRGQGDGRDGRDGRDRGHGGMAKLHCAAFRRINDRCGRLGRFLGPQHETAMSSTNGYLDKPAGRCRDTVTGSTRTAVRHGSPRAAQPGHVSRAAAWASTATCSEVRDCAESRLTPSTSSIRRSRSYRVGRARCARLAASALLPPASR